MIVFTKSHDVDYSIAKLGRHHNKIVCLMVDLQTNSILAIKYEPIAIPYAKIKRRQEIDN